jgi:hypothetical protein
VIIYCLDSSAPTHVYIESAEHKTLEETHSVLTHMRMPEVEAIQRKIVTGGPEKQAHHQISAKVEEDEYASPYCDAMLFPNMQTVLHLCMGCSVRYANSCTRCNVTVSSVLYTRGVLSCVYTGHGPVRHCGIMPALCDAEEAVLRPLSLVLRWCAGTARTSLPAMYV